MIDVPRHIYLALKIVLPLLWISGAVWVYIDAEEVSKKKKILPPIAWFIICLLSGPIAVFVFWCKQNPKHSTMKSISLFFILFILVGLFQFSHVADMPRWARIMDEIESERAQLKIGVSKEQVIELIGKPEDRSKQSVNQVRKVEVLEYRVGKGTAYFVFQSDILISKYYLEAKCE